MRQKVFRPLVCSVLLAAAACGDANHDSRASYVGLTRSQLWTVLCSQSGDTKTPITALQYPDIPDLRRQMAAMIDRNDAGNMPKVFRLAGKWRWDSRDRRFHEFIFSDDGVVVSVEIDTSWRP